jgi:hypothetical protein
MDKTRDAYSAPVLVREGDVREVTQAVNVVGANDNIFSVLASAGE